MPEKETVQKAKARLREGKRPTTAAGEFVHEEIEHVREGKHGARSTKQAIAIGLSKARRAGVPLKPPKKGQASSRTRRSAKRAYEVGQKKRKPRSPSRRRSTAVRGVLKRERRSVASKRALSRQARSAAARRRKRRKRAAPAAVQERRYWSREVTLHSNALDLEDGVFRRSPTEMARSLKRSAERSTRRKASPFQSAMSMLTFYENRAGKNLPASRKRGLQQAKQELRKLYGRAPAAR